MHAQHQTYPLCPVTGCAACRALPAQAARRQSALRDPLNSQEPIDTKLTPTLRLSQFHQTVRKTTAQQPNGEQPATLTLAARRRTSSCKSQHQAISSPVTPVSEEQDTLSSPTIDLTLLSRPLNQRTCDLSSVWAGEEIRTRDQLGITIECLKECDRRRDRCLAVTLDTSPSTAQRCYALQRGTDNDPNKLTTAPTVSFFEKTCIPELKPFQHPKQRLQTRTIPLCLVSLVSHDKCPQSVSMCLPSERSCGKAWAFVRVPGYDLEVNGLVLNNVPTRQECQAECLRATNIPCRSATYNIRLRTCRLMAETRRTDPESFNPATRDVEFLENQCAPDPPNCDYANYEGRFLPYFDRYFTNVFDTTECKKYCDTERDFTCRSFNFQSFRRECSLSSDDTFTVGGQGVLQVERDYFYSEKGACKTGKWCGAGHLMTPSV
ncbi:hypothetical protein E2C01_028992 [Portunus trituberculatus]|uniref:Apple domain-containing protein n=1 Tax=Portunus trituberculatus TaxID=210409 RepID=A0A5B7EQN0_PORTR|nr:hypothetical protein [Portunus trituberculatus]